MGFNPFRWIAAAWHNLAERRRLRQNHRFYHRLAKKFGVKLMLTGRLSDIHSVSQSVAAALVLANEAIKLGYRLEDCQVILDDTRDTVLLVPPGERNLVNYFVANDNRFVQIDLGAGLEFTAIDVTAGKPTPIVPTTAPTVVAEPSTFTAPVSTPAPAPTVITPPVPAPAPAPTVITPPVPAPSLSDDGPAMARPIVAPPSAPTVKTTEVRTGSRRALEAHGAAKGLTVAEMAFDAAKFVESLDLDFKFENYLETQVQAELQQETGRFAGRRKGIPINVRGSSPYDKLISAAEQADWDQRSMLVTACSFIDNEGRLDLFANWLAGNSSNERAVREPGAFTVVQAGNRAETTLTDDGTL